ncbi:MAG: ABC-2 transporter permease [Coriobacteriales bacterium]|jgi:ABC-type transport system involved in multi-copper enzyme maturation permease subunit|nr:ABC-2 transporter permease [Coriobacteriales bacterium]
MNMVIIPIGAYMGIAFSMNAFAVEEKGKLDHLYLSLPLSRSNIVRGRFAFAIFLLVVALVVCGLTIALTSPSLDFWLFGNVGGMSFKLQPKMIALICCLGFAFGSFMNLSMYPIMFKMGYEKGKVFGFIIPAFVSAALFGSLGVLMGSRMELIFGWLVYLADNPVFVGAIMLGIGAAMFLVSYFVSQWFYSRRNL